jgi:hypothetical protein
MPLRGSQKGWREQGMLEAGRCVMSVRREPGAQLELGSIGGDVGTTATGNSTWASGFAPAKQAGEQRALRDSELQSTASRPESVLCPHEAPVPFEQRDLAADLAHERAALLHTDDGAAVGELLDARRLAGERYGLHGFSSPRVVCAHAHRSRRDAPPSARELLRGGAHLLAPASARWQGGGALL